MQDFVNELYKSMADMIWSRTGYCLGPTPEVILTRRRNKEEEDAWNTIKSNTTEVINYRPHLQEAVNELRNLVPWNAEGCYDGYKIRLAISEMEIAAHETMHAVRKQFLVPGSPDYKHINEFFGYMSHVVASSLGYDIKEDRISKKAFKKKGEFYDVMKDYFKAWKHTEEQVSIAARFVVHEHRERLYEGWPEIFTWKNSDIRPEFMYPALKKLEKILK